MSEAMNWRTDGVRVVRATALAQAMTGPEGSGRATVCDFAGSGGQQTWVGSVVLPPGSRSGAHHHGHHELALCIVQGKAEIRWGERLEFVAVADPGDWIYFAPYVPHQEANLSDRETLQLIVVRSDTARIAVPLAEVVPAEQPETVY